MYDGFSKASRLDSVSLVFFKNYLIRNAVRTAETIKSSSLCNLFQNTGPDFTSHRYLLRSSASNQLASAHHDINEY